MIDNERRREVAKKMREYDVAAFKESAIVPFFECLGLGYRDWRGILDTLADLIDRPTCKKLKNDKRYWRCSRCGAFVRWDAVTDLTGVRPASYCPNCGAEVV
jgi:hypothetical protein